MAANDDWGTLGTEAELFGLDGRRTGAFPLRVRSTDAVSPSLIGAGSYTGSISDSGGAAFGSSGVVLAEIYEQDFASGRFVNFSALGFAGTGHDVMIAGFVVSPLPIGIAKKILIRGVGPALTAFGVSNLLANPTLSVVDSTGHTVATNDDWETNSNLAELRAATAQLAFPLASGSRDAALLLSLPSGAYTCVVSGVNNATGTALVEVYEVP